MLSVDRLHELFSTDSEGNLYWKSTRGGTARAGSVAGWAGNNGYRSVNADGRSYLVHRVLYAMTTGEWPADCVDHIDGNPANNRPSNLRACTRAQNQQNRGANRNNKLGIKGVKLSFGKYDARIDANGTTYLLGRFDTPEEAGAAYRSAAAKYHREFARVA